MHSDLEGRLTRLESLADPRLADFTLVGDPAALVQRHLTLLEGRLVLDRAVERDHPALRAVLLTDAAAAALGDTLARLRGDVPVYVVSQAVMNGVAGFNIHRGCLALAARVAPPTLSSIDLGAVARVLVLEGVSNPDNVGGLFRNAAAFAADLVVLGPDCGDPLYRKAIRTSMGAALHVPTAAAGPWPAALERLRGAGLDVWALTPDAAATPLRSLRPPPRVALVVGAEGEGLTPAALAAADRRVRIEMDAAIDSINVATAAALALWWVSAER